MQAYDAEMRTTVTIDDDLLAEAKAEAARQRRSLSELLQDALRASLRRGGDSDRVIVLPTSGDPRNRPLVDTLDKEALAEVLGDNEWPPPGADYGDV